MKARLRTLVLAAAASLAVACGSAADDAAMLQALLDRGGEVRFPAGDYTIGKTLVIGGGTHLVCAPGFRARLKDGANCAILANRDRRPDAVRDIRVTGGVWDGNNVHQDRSKYSEAGFTPTLRYGAGKYGQLIVFSGVKGLRLADMTVKDPQGFSYMLTDVEDFTVTNITFDCNDRTPNEDGVHVNGYARHGVIRGIRGHTNDDLVALNSDEGDFRSADCTIEDVLIEDLDGGERGYTGVRLLSRHARLREVTIRNIRGKFQFNVVSFTHWAGQGYQPGMGHFDNVLIEDITATSCRKEAGGHGGLIWFQPGVHDVGKVTIRRLRREEGADYRNAVHTIDIGDDVRIRELKLEDVTQRIPDQKPLVKCAPTARVRLTGDSGAAVAARADELKGPLAAKFLPDGADESSWASVYRQVDELDARADRAWLALKTRAEYDAHRKALQAKMIEAIGGLPERTPLNARTLATVRREGYVVEKVLFESMPGLLVTANLFLPDRADLKPPYAAVVMSCGHSQDEGKDFDLYQRACVHVVNRGMVALMFDPYEQGERRQYCAPGRNCCQVHNLIGLKAMLLGWSMPMLRLWDAMRAVDYVQSRPEVDAERIGYMGQSGGGTMSALMTAADGRLKATAPSCYLTSLGYLCKLMGPQDAEQNIFGQLAFGLNHTGYVLLPDTKVCVTGRFSDMFPWGGAAQLSRTVADVAAMLGRKDCYAMNFAPGPHGWAESTMAASADWMAAWLQGKRELLPLDLPRYRALDLGFSPKTVDCGIPAKGPRGVTPAYSTAKVEGTRDIHAILRERLADSKAKRRPRSADETAALVRRRAVIRTPAEAKASVHAVGGARLAETSLTRLAFMYPDGLALPAVLLEGPRVDPSRPPVLMVGARGRGAFTDEAAECLKRGERVLVADVTGTGEIVNGRHEFYACADTPEEGIAVMLYLMGESMVGRRASDILMLADWLRGKFGGRVRLSARGSVSVAAAHAFAADRAAFSSLSVAEAPASWTDFIMKPGAPLPFRYSSCVNGAMLDYDWTELQSPKPSTLGPP